jgi:SAM-dependent methyltransferase/DNA-binding transcriptional ArsR family regulator
MSMTPEQIVDALSAAGEPTRLRILAILRRGDLAVGELAQILAQSQPRVSRHLKLLADAGLVERAPEGAWVFFRLAREGAGARIAAAALEALSGDHPVLARDLERLAAVRAARAAAADAYFARNAAEWTTLRALHQPEAQVEDALARSAGEGPFAFHLDLGAGPGRLLELFAPRARRSEGLDASPQMLAAARAKLADLLERSVALRHGDVYALPHADGAADLVTLVQVLHYLQEPEAAVREAARVLAPGGTLLIADFASHDFEELRQKHAHRRLGFADAEVLGWLSNAGLEASIAAHIAPQADTPALAVTIWAARRPAAAARRAA